MRKKSPKTIKYRGARYVKVDSVSKRASSCCAGGFKKKHTAALDEPIKLYIADLEAYNAGKLVGEWVELPMDEEELRAITDKLTRGGQHDFAIHDYEAPFRIDEYANPFKLNELAEKLEDTNVPMAIITCAIDNLGIDPEDWDAAIEAAEDASVFEAKDEEDLAYEVIDQLGMEGINPEYYFDYDSFGRDLRIDGYGWDEDTEEDWTEGMSDQEVGEEYVDSMGSVAELGQKTIEMYFDYAKFGHELAMDYMQCGDYYISFP